MSTNAKAFLQVQSSVFDPVFILLVPVSFLNPEDVSLTFKNNVTGATRSKNSNTQFDRVTLEDFSTTLFIDASETRTPAVDNARTKVLLMRNMLMLPTLLAFPGTRVPAKCRLVWGTFLIEGYCTSIQEKYTYFSPDGYPLRAEVGITIHQTMNFLEALLYGNSTNSRKFWTVKSGDRLDLIARSMYNDSALWRPIAEANDIKRPIDFPLPEDIGRQLIIPDELNVVGG